MEDNMMRNLMLCVLALALLGSGSVPAGAEDIRQEAHPPKNQPLAEQPQKKPVKPPERGIKERGKKAKRPLPGEYGNVIMNNFSVDKNIAAVVFKHWLHRSKYTCRVCHVDIGFAMWANDTRLTGDDLRNGEYCGSCHNGKIAFASGGKN